MKICSLQLSRCALICLIQGFALTALAQQDDWNRGGDLEDVEIEIVKEREVALPPASRSFDKIPPPPAETERPSFSYDFRPFSFDAPQVSPSLRPLRLKQEQPTHVFGGYFSAGYGNYRSPYFEGFVNTRRDRKKLLGAHFVHRSSGTGPVDEKNSASGNTGVSLFGKAFSDVVSLSLETGYENRFTHFYGYPDGQERNKSDIRQAYNRFHLAGELSNTRNTDFTYKLGAELSYLADHYEGRESLAGFTFGSGYSFNEDARIAVDAEYTLISRKDSLVDAKARSLFSVNPRYVFYPVEDLMLSAGVVAAFENDTIDSRSVHAYPDLRASYPLSPSVELTASLRGGMERVSLHSLSSENMWLAANVPIYHTNKQLEFQAALHTRIGNKISVNGGFSLATMKNLYFFRNDSLDVSRFVLEYDDVTDRTNFFASLGFVQSEFFKFLIRGDVYSYSTEIDEAWHRPRYKVTGETSLNVSDKFLIDVSLIAQGGMKAFDPLTKTRIALDPAIDLNVRSEYLVSEKFSLFAQFNNILANEYPLFYRYPVRGFQGLGGFTWTF